MERVSWTTRPAFSRRLRPPTTCIRCRCSGLRELVEPEPLAQNLSDRSRACGGIGGTVELLGLPLRCRGNRLKQLLVRELEPCRRLRLGLGVQLVDAAGRPRRNGAPCVFRKVQDGLRPAN
jgi:hypothetical protein